MSKPISEFFLGANTNNIILKKSWSPSGGTPPTLNAEGYVFIAEDAGTVDLGAGDGPESFVEDDSIIYKDGDWIRFGSASGGLGGDTGATDNALIRADGTGGSTVQNSGWTIDDSSIMTDSAGTLPTRIGQQQQGTSAIYTSIENDISANTFIAQGGADLGGTKIGAYGAYVGASETGAVQFRVGIQEETTGASPAPDIMMSIFTHSVGGPQSYDLNDSNGNSFISLTSDGTDGTMGVSSFGTGDVTLTSASTGEVKLGLQTSAMNSSAPSDLAIATKKYVDDNAGINLATTDTWTSGVIDTTIGGQELLGSSGVYGSVTLDLANNTDGIFGAISGVPSKSIVFSGIYNDDADTNEVENTVGVIRKDAVSPNYQSAIRLIYTNDGTAAVNTSNMLLVVNDITAISASNDGSGNTSSGLAANGTGDVTLTSASTGEVKLGLQTSAMNSSAPSDLAIATKKYVDDNAGGSSGIYTTNTGLQTSNFTADVNTWYTRIDDVSSGSSAVTISTPASPSVGDEVWFTGISPDFAPDLSAFGGHDAKIGVTTKFKYSGLGWLLFGEDVPGIRIYNVDSTTKTSDFDAEKGYRYSVSDFSGKSAVVVSAPLAPNAGDEVRIESTSGSYAPDISDFDGLTMSTLSTETLLYTVSGWQKL